MINSGSDLGAGTFPTSTNFTTYWEPFYRDEINVVLKRDSDITDTRDLKLARVVIDRLLFQKYNFELLSRTADKSMIGPGPSLFDIENEGLRALLNNLSQDKAGDAEVAYSFNTITGEEDTS